MSDPTEVQLLRERDQAVALLQATLSTIPLYVARLDRQCRMLFLNKTRPSRPTEEYLGTSVLDWIPRIHAESYRRCVEEVFTTGEPRRLLFDISQPDEGFIWLDVHFGPLARDGEVVEVIVAASDVTEHRELDRRLRVGVELAQLVIWEWVWPDDVIEVISGTPRIAPPGQGLSSFLEQVHPEDRPRMTELIEAARSRLEPIRTDFRMIAEDGSVHWTTIHGEPRRDANGAFAGMLGASLDLTERKQAELGLARSEARLSQAIEAADLVLWEHESDTGAMSVTGAIWTLGTPPTRIEDWRRRIHPDDLPAALDIWEASHDGRLDLWSLRYRVQVGEHWRWFEDRGRVVERTSSGTRRVGRGTLIDVTAQITGERERRELQRRLDQGEKLQSLGRLAGGVAHDFNNLLQVVLGNLSLLEHDIATLPEVQQIQEAAGRAAELTRQLLTFGRVVEIDRESVDVNQAMERLVTMLRRLFPEDIGVDFIPGRQLGQVLGDPGRIDQVFMNLCLNARDAMPDGGRLTIETEQVLIDGEYVRRHPWAQPGRYVLTTVSDTGAGMPSDVVDKVFEPFFSTKEVGRGTGLGLATAYGIVEQHGGMIHVYSEEGVGTCFKVYLPLAERKAADVGTKLTPRVPTGVETVLVAEDEPGVRKLVRHLLERAGYEVYTASDGAAALRLFESKIDRIDLVLFDAVMPRMSGRDALLAIRKLRPDVPALLMSGYSAATLSGTFAKDNAVRILPKPFDPTVLLRAVREALETSG